MPDTWTYYSHSLWEFPPCTASFLRDILQDTGLLVEGVSDFLAVPGTRPEYGGRQLAKHDSDAPLMIA
jgi:hypothetical protein